MSQIEVRPGVYICHTNVRTFTNTHIHTQYSICARIRGTNNRANAGRFSVGRMCVYASMYMYGNGCAIENLSSENPTDVPKRSHFAFCS